MLQKNYTLLLAFFLLGTLLFAQDHAILTPGDQLIPVKGRTIEAALTGAKVNVMNHKVGNIILKGHSLQNAKGTIDTLSIKEMSGANFNVNFGMFDQQIMIQWYVAPADLIIKGVGFMPSDVTGAANGVAVSLVKTNLTAADIVAFGAPAYWGYWTGDDPTWNNAVPFSWQASGDWVAGTEGAVAPWTEDIWSDFGDGYVVTPVYDQTNPAYNWVVLNDALGFEPEQINRGQVFGVVVKNNGVNPEQPDESRIGLLSAGDMGTHPGFKYYAKGRLATDDQGWWSRKYTWDVVVAVDLVGDRPPVITDVDELTTTLSTAARTVTANITDDNPSGGASGVASAAISYTTDGGATWNDVAMTANGDVYSGDIPGQTPGTTVDYKVVATDVNGNTSEAGPWEYNIFQPVYSTLLVFNGYDKPAGYPQSYYFGQDDFVTFTTYPFYMDVWAYGELTAELVNNYTNIIEITTTGPKVLNSAVIADWLAADGGHNYMLAGDEWLGVQSSWTNGAHGAGDFIFDVLGVNYEYNDINYAATGDQNKASVVVPIENTLLGGPLFNKYTEINDSTVSTDTMLYNPYYEIGVVNWLDGVDFEADVEVDLKGVGVDGNEYNIAGHRTLPAGNKIVFLAYDPLSLDATPYYWYGFSASAPQVQAALWFGVDAGINPPPTHDCGDADEDGSVLAYDAALTLRHSIGLITLSEQGIENADVDMDEMVSAYDAALILRHVLALPEPVPTCFNTPLAPVNNRYENINLSFNENRTQTDDGKNVVDISLDGIIAEDDIYSFEADVALPHNGSLEILDLPQNYISGVNQIDDTHFKIAVVGAEGINGEDVHIQINFDDASDGSIVFDNIRLNGQSINNFILGIDNKNMVKEFKLVGNYPNPFNPSTKIAFEIPRESKVKIAIYDVLGKRVKTLVNRSFSMGRYELQWSGTDEHGNKLSSGLYIAVMQAGNYRHSIKMNLLK